MKKNYIIPSILVMHIETQNLCAGTYDSSNLGEGNGPGMGGNVQNAEDDDSPAKDGSLWEDFGFNEEF
ncbi:MAG: hypothetical protein IJ549_07915 [Prevotella sp.]|nr:hypothetical protein [Prevotella sp.]MBQ8702667.1 hypothetical protein [Prevotella sp.]